MKGILQDLDVSQENADFCSWSQTLAYIMKAISKISTPKIRLYGTKPVLIPSNSMAVITGSTCTSPDMINRPCMVQAVDGLTGTLPQNIKVVNTCVNNHDGHSPIRVVNIGSEDVWLPSKCLVGTLHPVEVMV